VVLLQRSEGGALGIGGGGGGMMSARGAANALTRTTGILAAAFFVTSLSLGILARYGAQPTDILDRLPVNQSGQSAPVGDGSDQGGSLLDQLGGLPEQPQAPAGGAATETAPSAADAPSAAPSLPDEAPAAPTGETTAAPAQPAPAAEEAPAPAAETAPVEEIPANPAEDAPGVEDAPTVPPVEEPAAGTTRPSDEPATPQNGQ
ncbi:MAG: preprotein translocase subunit SecG, partial [Aurantimonas coralicida]|nr:preprotein translocase subunit SecG [Aurantimonas coralicida]